MSYLSVHIYLSSYLPICLLYPFIGPFIYIHSYHTRLFIHVIPVCSYLPVFLSSHWPLISIHRSVHIYPFISYLSVHSCHTCLLISTCLPIFPSLYYIQLSVCHIYPFISYLSVYSCHTCHFISVYLSSICLLYPFIGPFISIHSYHTCLYIHVIPVC